MPESGADPFVVGGNEAPTLHKMKGRGADRGDDSPRLIKYFGLNGLSAISFWVSLQWFGTGQGLVIGTILKFISELSVIVWLNTAFYLKNDAEGIDVESWEFQREQIKLTLWIFGCLVLIELPLWISSF